MGRIAELAKMMKTLDGLLSACNRCGMCQAVCPLFAQTGHEGDLARGKLALLDGLSESLFKNADRTAERLNRCLLCGACEKNCSSNVSTIEIFIKARAIIAAYQGLKSSQKLIFRRLLSNPETFDRIMQWAARGQKLVTKSTGAASGTSCGRINIADMRDRHFLPLAEKPLHRLIPSLSKAPSANMEKVAFFPGCLLDKVFPHVALATLRVLEKTGVGIFMPEGQGCCGIPALSAGDTETFSRLVRHNIARFEIEKWDVLVTACATCTFTLKKLWPLMTGEAPSGLRQRVVELADKTMDISQFIMSRFPPAPHPPTQTAQDRIPVTYHDPCHLARSFDITREPRQLIASGPLYRLVEMPLADQCCGMGGMFNLKYYEDSKKIGLRKRESILASGCGTVATSCPACMLQLIDLLSHGDNPVLVKHVIEIYAENLSSAPYGTMGARL